MSMALWSYKIKSIVLRDSLYRDTETPTSEAPIHIDYGPPRTDQCRSPHSVMLFLYVCGLKIYIHVERKNPIFNWWTQNSLGENSNCFRWVCSLAKMRLFWQSCDRQERDKEKAELFYKRNWKEFWDSLRARESGEERQKGGYVSGKEDERCGMQKFS